MYMDTYTATIRQHDSCALMVTRRGEKRKYKKGVGVTICSNSKLSQVEKTKRNMNEVCSMRMFNEL